MIRAGRSQWRRVLILEPQLKQYRKQFLLGLAARLRENQIELVYAYSDPREMDAKRGDTIELDGGVGVKLPAFWLLGGRAVLQPAWGLIKSADLIIVDQGNKLLINYLLLLLSALDLRRVAYWGHGYNRQETRPGLSEWLKRRLLTRVDWWFAYTEGVARYLVENGVPEATVTTVHNTIDTRELIESISRVSPEALATMRGALGIGEHARVGVFCGSLYPDKKLEFLLAAAAEIHRRVPGFVLIIVGDGPDREVAAAAARRASFVHYVGPAFGDARAVYFALAHVFLTPGIVGLGVVDAFAAGLPVFTTELPIHGPEIEYIEQGVNGIVTAHDVGAYAAEVATLLSDDNQVSRLRAGARASANRLTLPRMIEEFATGIERCLASSAG